MANRIKFAVEDHLQLVCSTENQAFQYIRKSNAMGTIIHWPMALDSIQRTKDA